MDFFSIGHALLATQRALLRTITPELRAVVIDVDPEDRLFYMHFFYDGEVSEQLVDLWDCATTEASADLGIHCRVDEKVQRLDYPQPIPFRGRYAYLRDERKDLNLQEKASFISREIVDFNEPIGYFVCPVTGEKHLTSWGVIHYAEDGSHIIPAKPENISIDTTPVAYALLAIQRGLLGVVTPDLRAVVVDVPNDQKFAYIHFYYHGEVSDQRLDFWECAISEAIADLGMGYHFDTGVHRLDYPQEVPYRGRLAFFRKEE
jgi:hypothetical protein